MIKLIRKWWRYLTAKLTGQFEESADPKVQLEQAIREAQVQHRRLTEQAANVIAQQKQTQLRLERAIDDLGKANGSAKQALMLADEAAKNGDATKSGEYADAAEAFAGKLISLEKQIAELKEMLLNSTKAADSAKAAVQQNASALQRKYSEREKLLSQLDQAKMREEMNKAMTQLTATVGDEVPTFAEVQRKIEERLAKAEGMAELTGASVESRMLEVEQASDRAEAQARLSELRTQLGLKAPEPAQLPAAEEPQKTEG
ncbi:MAG: PspA/IM30 family protein [Acidimicrobiia bacterium]